MVTKAYGEEKAKEFKTKSLRDSYNDALLRANLTQEVKDTLFGHKRSGAKEKYAISPTTVIDAYTQAFKFLSVNHGTQARADFQRLDTTVSVLTEKIADLTNRLEAIAKIVKSSQKDLEQQKTMTSEAFVQVMANKQEILRLTEKKQPQT